MLLRDHVDKHWRTFIFLVPFAENCALHIRRRYDSDPEPVDQLHSCSHTESERFGV